MEVDGPTRTLRNRKTSIKIAAAPVKKEQVTAQKDRVAVLKEPARAQSAGKSARTSRKAADVTKDQKGSRDASVASTASASKAPSRTMTPVPSSQIGEGELTLQHAVAAVKLQLEQLKAEQETVVADVLAKIEKRNEIENSIMQRALKLHEMRVVDGRRFVDGIADIGAQVASLAGEAVEQKED